MGAGQSKLDDDFEGKYFTTGDGIKLSSQVLQRLSDEPERKVPIEDTVITGIRVKKCREEVLNDQDNSNNYQHDEYEHGDYYLEDEYKNKVSYGEELNAQGDWLALDSFRQQVLHEEMRLKDMERDLALKQLMSEKLQEMEDAHLNQKLEMEKQREKIMSDYDMMINSREKQIQHLITDLDNERTKYMDAVKNRDEKISQVCDNWTGKLQVKECEFQQLQDRLAEKENELTDVTNNMNSQIQQEKDKLSEYREIFNERVRLVEDQFKFAVDSVVSELQQYQKQFSTEFQGFAGNLDNEKNKFEGYLEQFASKVVDQEEKYQSKLENFSSQLENEKSKFQNSLDQFTSKIGEQESKYQNKFDGFTGKMEAEKSKLESYMDQIATKVGENEQKLNEVTKSFESKVESQSEKLENVVDELSNKITAQENQLLLVASSMKNESDSVKFELENVAKSGDCLVENLKVQEDKFTAIASDLSEQISTEQNKLVEVTESLTQQIKNEQDKLARISQTAHEEFEAAAKRVDKKFRPSGFESVCRPAQNNLVDCYNENPGKPLACYKQLNQFKQCVADTKMKLFEQEKAATTEEL